MREHPSGLVLQMCFRPAGGPAEDPGPRFVPATGTRYDCKVHPLFTVRMPGDVA